MGYVCKPGYERVADAEDEPGERKGKRGWNPAHKKHGEREEDEGGASEDRHDPSRNPIPLLVNFDEQGTGLSPAQGPLGKPRPEVHAHAQRGEKESGELNDPDHRPSRGVLD